MMKMHELALIALGTAFAMGSANAADSATATTMEVVIVTAQRPNLQRLEQLVTVDRAPAILKATTLEIAAPTLDELMPALELARIELVWNDSTGPRL